MTGAQKKLAVIAIGGNSLISEKNKKSVEDQYDAICETVRHIADVIASGCQVCVTHGNGPQVGFIMLRSEIARKEAGMHPVPLVSCVADTQGAIGWQIQQALANELHKRGIIGRRGQVVSIVTQVRVDENDPKFKSPDKYVGEFYDEKEVPNLRTQHPDWVLKEDPGRGWRRVVPSPNPVEIVELDSIKALLDAGFNIVTVGGGGIPVVSNNGELRGVDAVIDKDLATRLLATELKAPLLVISTGVEKVAVNYGKPDQKNLTKVSSAEMKKYLAEGQFPAGSMGPKVEAALEFLEQGGEEVIITSPEYLESALTSDGGTHITK